MVLFFTSTLLSAGVHAASREVKHVIFVLFFSVGKGCHRSDGIGIYKYNLRV